MLLTIKLIEHFGTQYFAAHYAGEVQTFLSTVQEVDIAGARICRDVMKYVMSAAYNGVLVRDTEDAERDAFFEENRRRRELQTATITRQVLPLPSTLEEVIPLIKSLDEDIYYNLPDGRLRVEQAFSFLVQAARPEIKIDLKSCVGEMLAFVYSNLFPTQHTWEEFYVLVGSTFTIQRPSPETYNQFLSENIVVPTDFGRKCLFKLPEWERCINRVSSMLEKSLRPKERKLNDFL